MWVYVKTEPQLWTVGFYAPDGEFHTDSDHSSSEKAAKRVQYLNGGSGDQMKKIRDEHSFIWPWQALNFMTWIFWGWERLYGKKFDRLEIGFRLFGFTHIREWR